jgi:hypothetical protein
MKKTYINPTIDVIKIQTSGKMASSVENFYGVLDETGTSGDNALSREVDFELDEEEENLEDDDFYGL